MKSVVLSGSVALALVLSGCGKSSHVTEDKPTIENPASPATLPEMERNPLPVVSETPQPPATPTSSLSSTSAAPSVIDPGAGSSARTIPQSSVLAAEMRARRQARSQAAQARSVSSPELLPAAQSSTSLPSGSAGDSSTYSSPGASSSSVNNGVSSGGVLNVSVPNGTADQPTTVPAALAQPDATVPANQAQLMDQLAEDFVSSVSNPTNSTATTGGQSIQEIWDDAQWQSDERFRRFFGQDAFLQYSKKAAASTETTDQGTN